MKAKVIKNLSADKRWDKCIGKIYSVVRTDSDDYLYTLDTKKDTGTVSLWESSEIEIIKEVK
jgi:hypothetical protein